MNLLQKRMGAAVSVVALAAVGAGGWLASRHRPARPLPTRPAYSPHGYGGFVSAPRPAPATTGKAPAPSHPTDPVASARDAYNAGRYRQAEAEAERVLARAAHSPAVALHRQAAFARQVLAYSAARRHDLPLARVRFAALQAEAAELPDGGKVTAPMGDPQPTLTEEAAFQHAVCTGALGDGAGAEAEYLAFMRRYPESLLVMAALKRLQRMHGGDAPPADAAVWRQAMATAQRRQKARMREASLCGPECLAELLRRRGEKPDVEALARAMGTSDRGTTLAALASAAKAHGFTTQGLALTPQGLAEQRLPVIALVTPGHYVLVDAVAPPAVTVWDPDAHGVGHGARRTLPQAQWGRMWQGVTLALGPAATDVRTASR